jgi:hypothetical protein
VPAAWRALLEELAPVFRRRSTHALFMALACGMILASRRTVVAMAAAGMAARVPAGVLVLLLRGVGHR